MKHSLYDKSRLTSVNVLGYISEQYPKSKMINKEKEKMLNITSFQQSLFGKKGDGDCTLVSLMTCLYYYLKEEIDKNMLFESAELLFRGQSNISYELIPAIGRNRKYDWR